MGGSSSSPVVALNDADFPRAPTPDLYSFVAERVRVIASTSKNIDPQKETQKVYTGLLGVLEPIQVQAAMAPLQIVSKGLFAIHIVRAFHDSASATDDEREVQVASLRSILTTYNTQLSGNHKIN